MTTRKPTTTVATPAKANWGFTGTSIVETAAKETELAKLRQEQKSVFRFWVREGEQIDVVFLDETFESGFALFEHAIPGPGNNWKEVRYVISPKSMPNNDGDPLETHPVVNGQTSKPYYVTYLTVLDLTPYTNKQNEVVPYTRKLLPIKKAQLDEFKKLADRSQKQNGKLRGLKVTLGRPSKGTQISAQIGAPQAMTDEFLTEAELKKLYSHPAIKSADGKVLVEANGKLQPIDYLSHFKPNTTEDIRRMFNIDGNGSSQNQEEAWDKAVDANVNDVTSAEIVADDNLESAEFE